MDKKNHCLLHSFPVTIFQTQNVSLGPRINSFSNDIDAEGQMDPRNPPSPISSLCSPSIFIKSWAQILIILPLAGFITVHSVCQRRVFLTCLCYTTTNLEKKELKQRMNRKKDFYSQHIIGIHINYISFSQKV